jgi:hypothetical protein
MEAKPKGGDSNTKIIALSAGKTYHGTRPGATHNALGDAEQVKGAARQPVAVTRIFGLAEFY